MAVQDIWDAFLPCGGFCNPREHDVRAIELHPEQHAAIVNYSTYKAAANALQALQGESERQRARAYIMFT